MIPVWLIPLTLPGITREFSYLYDKGYRISIRGVWNNDGYDVSLSVSAAPYISYGCNRFHTSMRNPSEVIRYFLMEFVNRMSQHTTEGLRDILSQIRSCHI